LFDALAPYLIGLSSGQLAAAKEGGDEFEASSSSSSQGGKETSMRKQDRMLSAWKQRNNKNNNKSNNDSEEKEKGVDLKLEALIKRQNEKCHSILNELTKHKQKTSHWAWWIFPTEMPGASEPPPATCVSSKEAAIELLARAPKEWRLVLEKIAELVRATSKKPHHRMTLSGVLPSIDHGRVTFFVRFWREVQPSLPSWLHSVLTTLAEATGEPPLPPLSPLAEEAVIEDLGSTQDNFDENSPEYLVAQLNEKVVITSKKSLRMHVSPSTTAMSASPYLSFTDHRSSPSTPSSSLSSSSSSSSKLKASISAQSKQAVVQVRRCLSELLKCHLVLGTFERGLFVHDVRYITPSLLLLLSVFQIVNFDAKSKKR
jgi:hypothetical protein